MSINTIPVENVAMLRMTKHVDTASSAVPPSSMILLAMVLDMCERKMRPASWTCPMAKGREEKAVKAN